MYSFYVVIIIKARSTLQWMSNRDVNLLKWPALSPDLNIMENIWGKMAKQVYKDGKQYENLAALKLAVEEAWADIELDYIADLYDSMKNRVFQVIKSNGGHSGY